MNQNKKIFYFLINIIFFLYGCAGLTPRASVQNNIQHQKEIDRLTKQIRSLQEKQVKDNKAYHQQMRRMEITLQLMEKNLQQQDQVKADSQITKKDTIGTVPLETGQLNLVDQSSKNLSQNQQKQAFSSVFKKTHPGNKKPNFHTAHSKTPPISKPEVKTDLKPNQEMSPPVETLYLLPSERKKAQQKKKTTKVKPRVKSKPVVSQLQQPKKSDLTRKNINKQKPKTVSLNSIPPLPPQKRVKQTSKIKEKAPLPLASLKEISHNNTIPTKIIDPNLEESPSPISLWIIPAAQSKYKQAFKEYSIGKYKKSISLFKTFLKKYPNDQNADNSQFWIANAYYNLGEYNKAIVNYRLVLSNYKHGKTINGYKTPDSILMIGRSYLKLKDKTNAQYYFRQTIAYYPNSISATKAQLELNKI